MHVRACACVYFVSSLFLQLISTYNSYRGASVNLGDDVPDPGIVEDGTKCGENKVINVSHLHIYIPYATAYVYRYASLINVNHCPF